MPIAYVVFRGHVPGVYRSWSGCEGQLAGFRGSKHRGYESVVEAERAWFDWGEAVKMKIRAKERERDSRKLLGPTFACAEREEGSFLPRVQELRGKERMRREARDSVQAGESGTVRALDKSCHIPDNIPCWDLTNSGSDDESQMKPSLKRLKTAHKLRSNIGAPHTDLSLPAAQVKSVSLTLKSGIPPGLASNDESQPEPIQLTEVQQRVVDMALKRKNIFLTGAAGSGKTSTLREILRLLNHKYKKRDNKQYPCVQVVAPTGIAALALGGRTTYSFASWNANSFQEKLEVLIKKGKNKKYLQLSFEHLEVLIIEEISMVEHQFLERLNLLMQSVLDTPKPFGGKQVIFLGDFHQLPPVKPFEFCLMCGEKMKQQGLTITCSFGCEKQSFTLADKWPFKAPVWADLKMKHVKLEQIHRQKDTQFQDLLNKIRNGIILEPHEWNSLTARKELPPRAFAIRLMSRLYRVKNFNEAQLRAIREEPVIWDSLDSARKLSSEESDRYEPRASQILRDLDMHKRTLTDHRYHEKLTLKKGAKVVLLSNADYKRGLVNGSQGEVVGFTDTTGWKAGEEAKSIAGERLQALINEFSNTRSAIVPIVRFTNGVTTAVHPVASESLRGTSHDRYSVYRTQIPLTLAWALSIHKSQGMTLEYVEVSSEDIFEAGQLYVGLSRATKLEGLTVTGYSRKQRSMDEDVLSFYENTKWEDLGPDNKVEETASRKEVQSRKPPVKKTILDQLRAVPMNVKGSTSETSQSSLTQRMSLPSLAANHNSLACLAPEKTLRFHPQTVTAACPPISTARMPSLSPEIVAVRQRPVSDSAHQSSAPAHYTVSIMQDGPLSKSQSYRPSISAKSQNVDRESIVIISDDEF